jgi:hypothetical protein
MSVTPIPATSPVQVQATHKSGGGGSHKSKTAQANQLAHSTNAKGAKSSFKSQIARRLMEADNATISDESKKKDPGAGNDQHKKSPRNSENTKDDITEETSGVLNVFV